MKERATFPQDIAIEGSYLLERPTSYDEQTISKKWKDGSAGVLTEFSEQLEQVGDFTSESIEQCFKQFLESKGLGIGAVLPLFRLILTGTGMGPSMFEISAFLGKTESINRMKSGISTVESLKK
jgi:glutamyl-tRNA synthetase